MDSIESRSMRRYLHALVLLAALFGPAVLPAEEPAKSPAAAERRLTLVFLGDSLTAGYGLDTEQAYPALIEKKLLAEGRSVEVVNAGISGDTTAGGLARMDWLLRRKPDVLVVGLGANDGLRGLSLASSEKNLRAILAKGKAAGAKILLLGMQIPPNYGPEYTTGFAAIYPRLAKEEGLALMPFLLSKVAGKRELNQADGIHPTAKGQEIVAGEVLTYLQPLLAEAEATKSH